MEKFRSFNLVKDFYFKIFLVSPKYFDLLLMNSLSSDHHFVVGCLYKSVQIPLTLDILNNVQGKQVLRK